MLKMLAFLVVDFEVLTRCFSIRVGGDVLPKTPDCPLVALISLV